MEVNELEQLKAMGRVFSNNAMMRMLLSLAKGPLPKEALTRTEGLPWSTAWWYVKEMRDAGLTVEYTFSDGSISRVMVKLKSRDIKINLDKVK